LDWTVPREWNIRGAYVACRDGSRIADFTTNNLCVLQYSTPIDALIPLTELRPHLHTLPDTSDWIFLSDLVLRRKLGFCLTHRQLSSLI
jgi:aminopeptidase-like protein